MKKRLCSILFVVLLLTALLSMTAAAADETYPAEPCIYYRSYDEIITVLEFNHLSEDSNYQLLFYDGEQEIALKDGDLVSEDPSVASITFGQAYGKDWFFVSTHKLGSTNLVYTAADGTQYKMPVICKLRDVFFYSKPEATFENMLSEMRFSDHDVFYLVTANGYTIADISTAGLIWPDSEFIISEDKTYAEIRVKGALDSKYGMYWLGVIMTSPTGYTKAQDIQAFSMDGSVGHDYKSEEVLSASGVLPGAKKHTCSECGYVYYEELPTHDEYADFVVQDLYQYTAWDNDMALGYLENRDYEYYDGESSMQLYPGEVRRFMAQDVDNHTEMDLTTVSIADPTVAELSYYKDAEDVYYSYFTITALKQGETELQCTNEDGELLTIPIKVDSEPILGLYSSPDAAVGSEIKSMDVSYENNVIYAKAAKGWTIQNLCVVHHEQDGLDRETITIEGNTAQIRLGRALGGHDWNVVQYTITNPYGISYKGHVNIVLNKVAEPAIYCRGNYDGAVDEYVISSCYRDAGSSSTFTRTFYYFDGKTEKALTLADLTFSDPNLLSVKEKDGKVELTVTKAGYTDISYTAPDGTTVSMPAEVLFPNYAFFTTPEATNESYIGTFTLDQEHDTVYLVASNGSKIYFVDAGGTGRGEVYEKQGNCAMNIAEDGSYMEIKFIERPKSKSYTFYYGVNEDGGTAYSWLTVKDERFYGAPGLYTKVSNEWADTLNIRIDYKHMSYELQYFDGEKFTPVTENLTVADEGIAVLEEGFSSQVVLTSKALGATTISYAAPDGNSYSMNLVVGFPDVAFFSTDTPTVDGMLETIKLKDEAQTIYLIASNGLVMEKVESRVQWCELDITLSEDGTCATIVIPGGEFEGAEELEVAVRYGNSITWAGIQVDSGKPAFYCYYPTSDEETGSTVPNTSYKFKEYYDDPMKDAWTPLFFVYYDGETEHFLTAADLKIGNTDVIWVEDLAYTTGTEICLAHPHSGTTEITYTAPDGTVFTIPVVISLPDVGFYKTPEATDESYIAYEFTVTDKVNTLYLISRDGKLADLTQKSGWPESNITVSEDGSCATVEIVGAFEDDYYSFNFTNKTNNSTWSSTSGLYLIDKRGQVICDGDHKWDEGVITKRPTEQEEGIKTFTCTICQETKTEPIEKLAPVCEHKNTTAVKGYAATCTKDGLTDGVKCADCNEVITEQKVIAATGHTEVEYPAVEPTCTTNGKTAGLGCSVCWTTIEFSETIPALGHKDENKDIVCDVCEEVLCTDHKSEVIKGKNASCTEDGLTDGEQCSVCGKILKEQESIPALGHDPETVKGKEATCTETGLTDGEKCSVCSTVITKQEEIPVIDHKYTDGKCELCGEADPDFKPEEKPDEDVLRGDMDGNGKVNSDDAIYLLRHTLMASLYPIEQDGDMDGNGKVNSDDAIYLLRHTLLPSVYPLH